MSLAISEEENALLDLKTRLCTAKSRLDGLPHLELISCALDQYGDKKHTISANIRESHVSNAWLKCFEILTTFKLLRRDTYHFDNGALPGGFIKATAYILDNLYPTYYYNWRAYSLYDEKMTHLEDTYQLYEWHRSRWLMSDTNNGDITSTANIMDVKSRLKIPVNLYTSDIGFDVSEDYNNQEIAHFAVNAGQILLCIEILQSGGNCIIKHFTCFEGFTLEYLSIFFKLFESMVFHKPTSSKPLNSEVYLVGRGFLGADNEDCKLLRELLIDSLNNRIFTPRYAYPTEFVRGILPYINSLVDRQIHMLDIVVETVPEINAMVIPNIPFTKTSEAYYKACAHVRRKREPVNVRYKFTNWGKILISIGK